MTSDDIIARLGGPVVVAELCECSPQAVSQWHGKDPVTGKQREIPKARLLYLKAIKPEVFEDRRKHAAAPKLAGDEQTSRCPDAPEVD